MSSFRRKKDSFYVILKWKYSFRRDSNPRFMDYESNSLPLTKRPDLLMNGHKSSIGLYQLQNMLLTNQSGVRNCHKLTNCEHFRTKCSAKMAETLTLASTLCRFEQNVPRMLKSSENDLKFCDVRLGLLIENRRSSLYQ